MKRLLSFLNLMVVVVTMMAVPAKRGQWKTLKLADGTEVRAQLVGDEHGHFWKSADGLAYTQQGDNQFFQQVDANVIQERAQVRRHEINAKRVKHMASRRVGEVGNYQGTKKAIIILVNFSNKSFKSANNNALYQRIANEEGFSEGNFKGSMADYFKAQSRGLFELEFDVVGPVTVSQTSSYYGGNDSSGNDNHPGQMICEAINLAKQQVSDWKPYDWDDDGYVDQVYVVYAGQGEADGGAANTIWPHAWSLSSAKSYGDGSGPITVGTNLKVDTYACGCELNGSNQIEGIGTMCHEFSHCLGYPDFYDIDYSGGQGMGPWDLMDGGSYNGDGYQPAGYTSYERWVAGWLEPIVLEDANVNVENMNSLQNGGECYIIYNKGNRNEYYLLENRQLEGWDASLVGAGLLIIHVDYSSYVWAQNGPNNDPNHQRMTVVPADGRYQKYSYWGSTYYSDEGIAADPFPQDNITVFNKDFKTYDNQALKAAKLFNKNSDNTYWIDSSVKDITQNSDGTVSFKFVAIEGDDPNPDDPSVVDPDNPDDPNPDDPNPDDPNPDDPSVVDPDNPDDPNPDDPTVVDPDNPDNPDPENPDDPTVVDPDDPDNPDPENPDDPSVVDPDNPNPDDPNPDDPSVDPVLPEGTLLSETFDNLQGEGGNDNIWSGAVALEQVDDMAQLGTDMKGWTSDNAFVAYKCIKLGTSNTNNGSITSPAFTLNGTMTLKFRAGAWNVKGEGTTLIISVDNGTVSPQRVTMPRGGFAERKAVITANGDVRITFEAEKGRFFLDDVVVSETGTTGIQTVMTDMTFQPRYYTLDGRFAGNDLNMLRKGIYLVHGNKVIVK